MKSLTTGGAENAMLDEEIYQGGCAQQAEGEVNLLLFVRGRDLKIRR